MFASALLLLLPAHIGPLGARQPFVDDGRLVGGSTSWGLVLVDDDGVARRTCDEATGAPALLHLPVDGAVVGVAGGNVVVTDDRGCDWSVSRVPAGGVVQGLAKDGGSIFAAVGRAGFPSGVVVSVDGGRTFAASGLFGGADPFFDVVAAGGVVWASGQSLDQDGPIIAVSADAGASFVVDDVVADFRAVRVLASDDVGGAFAAGVRADGSGEVLHLGPAVDDMRSLGAVPLPPTHVALLGDVVFAVVEPGQLWRNDGAGFVAVADREVSCVFVNDGVLWVCGSTVGSLAGVHFARSDDGGLSFTVALRDDEVVERDCEDGSSAAAVCVVAPVVAGEGEGEAVSEGEGEGEEVDVDAGEGEGEGEGDVAVETTEPRSGSCASTAAPSLWLMAALLARRRRRQLVSTAA